MQQRKMPKPTRNKRQNKENIGPGIDLNEVLKPKEGPKNGK